MPQSGDTTGFPNPTLDHAESSLNLHHYAVAHPDATYFWRAEGDGMRDAGIFSGDVLIIDCVVEARPGDVVVAIVAGEHLVRRYQRVEGRVTLLAEHPGYVPIVFGDEEICTIWGVVIYVLHNPNPGRHRP